MTFREILARESLTELRLVHDYRSGRFDLSLARTFDRGIDWSRYATGFQTDSLRVAQPAVIGDREARRFLRARGLDVELATIEKWMSEGRHEMARVVVEAELGMSAALFVHSSVLGRNNGLHALRAGGYRRHELDEDELSVFEDGLNLGRAMSFKNAAADLPLGGCKMTVQCAPVAVDDFARMGFLAYAIDSGRFLTGPDMGFLPEHTDVLRGRFTRHTTGGKKGPIGPTGTPTALGCFLAIREAAEFAFGSRDLAGKRVIIQGAGAVGLPLAGHLAEAGMKIAVADVSAAAIEAVRARLGGAVEVVAPERVLSAKCDVFAPCAGGAILTDASIAALDCRMVYGSANNPLAAHSKDEEIRLAKLIRQRGILFQIEWTHNTAGVMAGFEEYVRGDQASAEGLRPRLEKVCRDGTRRILEKARTTGKTPTEVAYEEVESRIYPASYALDS